MASPQLILPRASHEKKPAFVDNRIRFLSHAGQLGGGDRTDAGQRVHVPNDTGQPQRGGCPAKANASSSRNGG